MKRTFAGGVLGLVLLTWSLFSGCALVPAKPDVPPPLPPIEEPKPQTPPLTLKGDHFKAFPWGELPKLSKDGNDPDTTVYNCRSGDTIDKVAEEQMGDSGLAGGLARFNDIADKGLKDGDKLVIPNPIIGVSSQMVIKAKNDKEFGQPEPMSYQLSKDDRYKFVFETNVNGYLYVYRTGLKGTVQLFPAPPAKPKPAPRGRKPTRREPETPPAAASAKVTAHQPVSIPAEGKGYLFDPKAKGDQIHVFLSLQEIPALEGLKSAKKIEKTDLDLKDEINEAKIVESPPVRVIRIQKPSEVLGFTLGNISG